MPVGESPLNEGTAREPFAVCVAVDSTGAVLVGWAEKSSSSIWGASLASVYVKRWNGTSWTLLGGGAVTVGARRNASPSLTVIGTVPYVAFEEDDFSGGEKPITRIRVMTVGAQGWTSIPLPAAALDQSSPSLAVTDSRLLLVFLEGAEPRITRAISWTPATWTSRDLGVLSRDSSEPPAIALASAGPIVAWHASGTMHASAWVEPTWITFDGVPASGIPGQRALLAVLPKDAPVIAWTEISPPPMISRIYVRRYNQ
jgi:hypothetical protein